jgi:hypothetical protein
VAWGPRLCALDLLFKLKGSYAEDRKDSSTKVMALPEEYMKAISRALGVVPEERKPRIKAQHPPTRPWEKGNEPQGNTNGSALADVENRGGNGLLARLPAPSNASSGNNRSNSNLDGGDELPILP